MKVYVRAPMSDKGLDALRSQYEEVVYEPWNENGERFYEKEMLEALQRVQPDILITELDRVTEYVLSGYKGLKAIGDCRAAPANIDVQAASAHKIPLLCTPVRNAQAVAEMLVGMLIAYMRNLIPSVQWIKDGEWREGTTPYYTWMGHELQGKTIGFVGFGAVGKTAAGLLEAFGCNICFYDPFVERVKDSYKKCELDEIFETCDIVSIHLPVLESTKGMISRELLYKMKPEALFVNTARSAVVDMHALSDLLHEKRISGALLDVLDTEPPCAEDLKIMESERVLLTPHICGAAFEVCDHQSDIIVDRLMKWRRGEDLEKVVYNFRSLEG